MCHLGRCTIWQQAGIKQGAVDLVRVALSSLFKSASGEAGMTFRYVPSRHAYSIEALAWLNDDMLWWRSPGPWW
jgi:hypothetical protein